MEHFRDNRAQPFRKKAREPRPQIPVDRERPQARCIGCNKTPSELPEYSAEMQVEPDSFNAIGKPIFSDDYELRKQQWSPDDYVWKREGTLNSRNGHFTCDACYIRMGQPSLRLSRWVAP